MAKTTGRPSGGNKNKDPGDRNVTRFSDSEVRLVLGEGEDENKSVESDNQSRVTRGTEAAVGIENDGTNDAIMTDISTKQSGILYERSDANGGGDDHRDEKMSDTTDGDRRRAESRGASGKSNDDASQSNATHLDINEKGDQDAGCRKVRLETFVKAGEKFSPVRTMKNLLDQVWKLDEFAVVTGSDSRELCFGAKIPKNKELFNIFFKMEQAEQNGGTHVGFAFGLTSKLSTEKIKQANGIKQLLADSAAWLNDQREFMSPLTCVAGWLAMVPPSLAAHYPFVMTIQDCWISHVRFGQLLGDKCFLGSFPPLSLRVAKVFADPKNKGADSVWTLLVEVRCELEYVDAVVEIATTGDYRGQPCGLFISKEAATDVAFMTEIIKKHNKVNSNLVVIPMEGFSPTLLDAPAVTMEGSSHKPMMEAILGMTALYDDEGQKVQTPLFTGIYVREDSEETGVIYITTTKGIAKQASRAIDDDVIPMVMALPCYKNFRLDKQYGPGGIRRKQPRVIKSRKQRDSDANQAYMARTRQSMEQIEDHSDQKFNSFQQRSKRQPIPAEIIWNDDDPPIGKGATTGKTNKVGTAYKEALGRKATKNSNGTTASNDDQNYSKDDGTSIGDGSGEVIAMTLATLYTTIDDQATTIGNQQAEINALRTKVNKQLQTTDIQEATIQKQKEYYESKIESVEKSYIRKLQVAEGNAELKAQQLEKRLEEKWEKRLQSTIEELTTKMASLQGTTAQYVTINSSPSDSSSLTTRTRGLQSPETATVTASTESGSSDKQAATTTSDSRKRSITKQTVSKMGGNDTASMSDSAQSSQTANRVYTSESSSTRPNSESRNESSSQNNMGSAKASTTRHLSNVSFDPNTTTDPRKTMEKAADKSGSQGTAPIALANSSLARASRPIVNPYLPKTSQPKATKPIVNPYFSKRTQPATKEDPTTTSNDRQPTQERPATKAPPATTTLPRPDVDAMDSESLDTSTKRNKETSPNPKELTPTSHHTHKKSRGRHGSPVRKAAQTDRDRGCEPVDMEVERENRAASSLLELSAINKARQDEGMSSLEILTPSKKPAGATSAGTTPVRDNTTPPNQASPKEADKSAIENLSSPAAEKAPSTPIKAKNLASKLAGDSESGWDDDEWLAKAVDEIVDKESGETTSVEQQPVATLTTKIPKEASLAKERGSPKGA